MALQGKRLNPENKMDDKSKRPEMWRRVRSETGPDLKLFRVRYDWMENPRNQKTLKRTVLESVDWVNIVAVTPQNRIIVVRQYRFGTGRITTEIPGGMVDSGETSEQAAARELQEETGYTSSDWQYLGAVEPNPAFQDNLCHHWLALDVEKTEKTDFDDGEDIVVAALSIEEIRSEIKAGYLRHSLALTALSHVFKPFEIDFNHSRFNEP